MGRQILANIAAALTKMLATFLFALLSSRLLLSYTGIDNFGAIAAVGASGVFLTFLTASLVRGIQREVAYAIGSGNIKSAREMFSCALGLFAALAVVAVIIGIMLKSHVLGILRIPAESSAAIEWLYDVMAAQIGISIIYAPYRAALEGAQRITVLSAIDIVSSGLTLLLLFGLPFLTQHVLYGYGVVQLTVLITSVVTTLVLTRRYCWQLTGGGYSWGRKPLKGALSITGWSLLGHLNWILRSDGTTFALNVFYGPVVNSAYALALKLHALQNELSFVFIRALQPALTQAVAGKDNARERELTILSSKVPATGNLVLWIPILLCAEDIFMIWLGQIPEGGPLFLRLLGAGMIGMISYGHHMALEAKAMLASVTLWVTLPSAMLFAILCWLHSQYEMPFWSLPVGLLTIGLALMLIVRPWLHGRALEMGYPFWVKSVLTPYLKCYFISFVVPLPLWYFLEPGFIRLFGVTCVAACCLALSFWRFGLTVTEKRHVIHAYGKFMTKMTLPPSSIK